MSPLCEQVDEFADGELSKLDAEVFQGHLANCLACQGDLHGIMQLSSASFTGRQCLPESELKTKGVPLSPVLPIRKRRWVAAAALLAAAAIALLVFQWRSTQSASSELSLFAHLSTNRTYEGRFAYEGLSSHRPYQAMRSGSIAMEDVPANVIAALESKGDAHGVGAAYLLVGSVGQARRELTRLAPTPGTLSDRALLELLEGHPTEALEVLESIPDNQHHPAALWNQALALRDLELSLLSAQTFDKVAAQGEPGWSDEARERAKALRARVTTPRKRFAAAIEAGTKFALGGEALSPDFIASAPGIARLYLYDAVRIAESPKRLDAIAPVAQRLDAIYGEDTLSLLVENSKSKLVKRGALRARYFSLIAGDIMKVEERQQFLTDARTANDPLMLIGAILYAASPSQIVAADSLTELNEAARSLGDPWFLLLAAEQHAQERIASGDYHGVHTAIASVLPLCAQASAIDYRCMRIESAAGVAYAAFHQITEARRVMESGWRRARKTGFTPYEVRFLQQMADLNLVSDQVAGSHSSLTRAYLQEALLRYDDCSGKIYAHGALAELLINQNRPGASAHMRAIASLQADGCESPMTFARALVLAQLGELGEAVTMLRKQSLSPGQTAFADHIEGRAWLVTNHEQGRERLRRGIERANVIEGRDIYASKARAYGYSVLALDSGRLGNYDEALELLAEELGATPANKCTVGVVEEDALVAVVRGYNGHTRGRYVRSEGTDTSKVLDEEMVASLKLCEVVDVFARPPHFGVPSLLPASLAWRYRLAGEVVKKSEAPRKRIVISGVDAPKELGLAVLKVQERLGAFHLQGAQATPRRVLQFIETATTIEFHVHGIAETTDTKVANLVLSPDPDGTFMLTSGVIRSHRLHGAPLVFLASCHGGAGATLLHRRESLVTAFLEAGARAVIASRAPMPDTAAGVFFAGIAARVEAGATAPAALRDERAAWAKSNPAPWISDLVVFE